MKELFSNKLFNKNTIFKTNQQKTMMYCGGGKSLPVKRLMFCYFVQNNPWWLELIIKTRLAWEQQQQKTNNFFLFSDEFEICFELFSLQFIGKKKQNYISFFSRNTKFIYQNWNTKCYYKRIDLEPKNCCVDLTGMIGIGCFACVIEPVFGWIFQIFLAKIFLVTWNFRKWKQRKQISIRNMEFRNNKTFDGDGVMRLDEQLAWNRNFRFIASINLSINALK